MNVLLHICGVLNCDSGDIMEFVEEEAETDIEEHI